MVICPPGDIWPGQETFLVVITRGWGRLLASGRWEPRMLLNIPQCPGQPPTPTLPRKDLV